MLVPILFALSLQGGQAQQGDPTKTEVWSPVPPIVKPGPIPSDAISLSKPEAWNNGRGQPAAWTYENGEFTVKSRAGDLLSNQKFGDCQLHVEFKTPVPAVGEGQGRGNSGVFMMDRYEIQILDSFENKTYSNGQAASLYKQHMPLVNASLPPGTWQTYDIIFTAPRFAEDGKLVSPGYATVIHNGVLVQNHAEIKGTSVYVGEPVYKKHEAKEPIRLQNHGNPVSFRNMWIREL